MEMLGNPIRTRVLVAIGIVVGFHSFNEASANSTICNYYRRKMPSLYKQVCQGGRAGKSSRGGSTTAGGASGSTQFNTLDIFSSRIPTDFTGYGFEGLLSKLRRPGMDIYSGFTLIRGFGRIGTGITTGTSNNFFSNDIVMRTRNFASLQTFYPETPKTKYPNANLGLSVLAIDAGEAQLTFGVSLRYNNIPSKFGFGTSLTTSYGASSISLGAAVQRVSNFEPDILFTSAAYNYTFWVFNFEYIAMKSFGGTPLSFIHVGGVSAYLGPLLLVVAVRNLDTVRDGFVTQYHYGLQMKATKWLSIGAFYNYIGGANTIATQIVF